MPHVRCSLKLLSRLPPLLLLLPPFLPSRAVGVGILKVMAKMGISTLASYKGAQIFEVTWGDRV
jgi:hypothetical protein